MMLAMSANAASNSAGRGKDRGERADRDPDDRRHRPGSQDIGDHQPPRAVRPIGAQRGRDDDRERGADAQLHAHLLRHAERPEHLEQHRHDDRAAADPEQPGEDPGDDPGGHNPRREPDQIAGRHCHVPRNSRTLALPRSRRGLTGRPGMLASASLRSQEWGEKTWHVVETEHHGQILVVRMNRPERLNALNDEMRTRLAETWTEFRHSDDFEVAIFTGSGRGFCAGEDMKELVQHGTPGGRRPATPDPFMSGALEKPVIAAVNGFAMGGGFMLVERSDLRVAAKGAVFEVSEAKRWLLGGYNHGHVANLPYPIAMEMALGFRFTAERFYEIGFLNRLVEPDQLIPSALAMAEHLLDPAAGLARQHRAHDAPDASDADAGTAAPGGRAARARRQERSDGIARRLCREAGAPVQGLGRSGGPLPTADARCGEELTAQGKTLLSRHFAAEPAQPRPFLPHNREARACPATTGSADDSTIRGNKACPIAYCHFTRSTGRRDLRRCPNVFCRRPALSGAGLPQPMARCCAGVICRSATRGPSA